MRYSTALSLIASFAGWSNTSERLANEASGPIGSRMPVVRARTLVTFFDQYAARLIGTGSNTLAAPHCPRTRNGV